MPLYGRSPTPRPRQRLGVPRRKGGFGWWPDSADTNIAYKSLRFPGGDYAPTLLDGEWHEIVVLLEPLLRGEGETFDSEKTWEIDFDAWTMQECEYTLALDEIAFS